MRTVSYAYRITCILYHMRVYARTRTNRRNQNIWLYTSTYYIVSYCFVIEINKHIYIYIHIICISIIYIYIPEPPIGTQKCVPFFSARFQKMCPFKGLKKKGVRSSVALLSIQPDSFPKGSIGHFCHALVHVQHAKYDLEQLRLTTWVASQHM
jgi:hypothetical protein